MCQLIFCKGVKVMRWRQDSLSTDGAGAMGHPEDKR